MTQTTKRRSILIVLAALLAAGPISSLAANGTDSATDAGKTAGRSNPLTVGITQIDTSRLMAFQRNRLYIRALSPRGEVLEAPDLLGSEQTISLDVHESSDGIHFVRAGRAQVQRAHPRDAGISFLFLVDNSLSMYNQTLVTSDGREGASRAEAANEAAKRFLLSISSARDKVGLASFNTRYELVLSPTANLDESGPALDRIVEPGPDDGYTELYAGLVLASRDLGEVSGRRALVVLSDGENFPWHGKRGSPSPVFGEKDWRADEALEEAVRQGVTVFAIHFGTERDDHLSQLARASGGQVFNASNDEELAGVYSTIRDNIRRELLLEYRALMLEGDRRWVRLVPAAEGQEIGTASPVAPGARAGDRYYYTGTVFGAAGTALSPWFLLLVPLALLFPLVMALIPFEKPSMSANLSLLYATGAGRGTKVFAVGDRTVIGADARADVTIVGNTRLEESPVTIIRDERTGSYTIKSSEAITVNNRQVREKTLVNGDVINADGTLVVFDDNDGSVIQGKGLLARMKRFLAGQGGKQKARKGK